jgi:NHL repeat
VRSHAKASTAGSTQRQATGLGRIHLIALSTCALALLAIAPAASASKSVVTTLGTADSGATGGRFNSPTGAAVNQNGAGGVPAGTFYVLDRENRRIQRFSPTGDFVSAWGFDVEAPATGAALDVLEVCTVALQCRRGDGGNGPGQLSNNGARGIAVEQSSGNVFVSDQTNRRISVYAATGAFQGGFGWGAVDGTAALQFCTAVSGCNAPAAAGSAAGQLGSALGGLTVDAAGNLYLANETSLRVDVFKLLKSSKTKAVIGVEFLRAFGWGVDTGADAFEVCTVASTCAAGSTAAPGNQEGQFANNSPSDVALDSAGNVYALDKGNNRVQKFSSVPAPVDGAFGNAALSDAFSPGALQNIAVDSSSVPNHVMVSGQRGGIRIAATGPSIGTLTVRGMGGTFHLVFGGKSTGASGKGAIQKGSNTITNVTGGTFLVGQEITISGEGSSPGTRITAINPGAQTITISQPALEDGADRNLTANLPHDAPASLVQTALEALSTIGAGNVTVSGGPGSPSGSTPYEIAFTGALAGAEVSQIAAASANPSLVTPVAVAELDSTGASVDTHGADLTTPLATGLTASPASVGGAIFLTTNSGGHFLHALNEAAVPTIDPVTVHTGTTATFSGDVVSNGSQVSYHFEYSTDGLGWTKLPEVNLSGAPGAIGVEQNASGLSGSQLHHVRLVAARPTPAGTDISTETTFTTDAVAPALSGVSSSDRTDTTVKLGGAVNPQNQATTYRFEYLTEAAYQANGESFGGPNAPVKSPAPDASAGQGNAPLTVSRDLAGLQPETKYRFRLVAVNATGTTEGAVQSFTTYPAQGNQGNCPNEDVRAKQHTTYLPDCRGIELVNPPDKGNQHVVSLDLEVPGGLRENGVSSPDGESAGWTANAGIPGGTTAARNPFLATRSASGWRSESLTPPASQQPGGGNMHFALISSAPDLSHFIFMGVSGALAAPDIAYVRGDRDGGFDVLGGQLGVNADTASFAIYTSTDTAHLVTTNATTRDIYDYGTGTPEIVNLMSDGEPPACGVNPGNNDADGGFPPAVAGFSRIALTDASRVFFGTSGDNCSDPLGLYVRNREAGTTTMIAAEGRFVRATPDGREAIFITPEALDPDDSNAVKDIYRWSEQGDSHECVTCVVPSVATLSDFQILPSEDLSRIYFVSNAQLVPGEGKAGARNLYVINPDSSLDFVARLTPTSGGVNPLDVRSGRALMTADGRVLVFPITEPPSADGFPANCVSQANPGPKPCEAIYRYDAVTAEVACVNCVPGGVTTKHAAAGLSWLSADGSTVAFTAEDALVPRDVNDGPDIYRWRGGEVRLITDGVASSTGSTAPQVRGVDATGKSIFFTAVAQITGFEQDGLANLFVAREGGGFEPPVPPVHCAEDSCQGPLEPAPDLAPLASTGFKGNGNEAAKTTTRKRRPCARKRGRGKRRCIRQQKRRAQKARANADAGRTK